MVLELRAPEQAAFSALWPLWSTAISYAVSYLFIAIIWINHHYLMRFVGTPTLGCTCGECQERTGSRLNPRGGFAPGQNQNEPRQNNGWKEARCRKLRHERGKRRQDCQYPRHHQVAFVRENDLFFAADPKCFTIETAGLVRSLHDRAVRWIPAKPVQSPPLLTPNF
jgi:Endosomal/lysosomal potassium channel TMEM175